MLTLVSLLAFLSAHNADIYPAGSRIALEIRNERHITIAAAGPSILWVRGEAPGLTMLRVRTGDVISSSPAVNGVAECIVPVYTAGSVAVLLNAAPLESQVVVTSFYGVGEAVGTAPLMPPPLAAPGPMEPAVPIAPTIDQTPAVVVPQPPPAATPPIQPSDIPVNELKRSLFFGDVQNGTMAGQGVETFRVYVPNREAFSVIVTGSYGVRVISEATGAEFGAPAGGSAKSVRITAPTEGYYIISIGGTGPWTVQAQNAN